MLKIFLFIFFIIVPQFILSQNSNPKMFGEGIISTGDYDTHPAFSPTGDTLFFVKCSPDFSTWTIYVSYNENGNWTEPEVAEFSGYMDADPFFTKDGKTIFFISGRPLNNDTTKTDLDIWKVTKTEDGWSDPIRLDSPLNSNEDEFYPTVTKKGTIYFGSSRAGGFGSCDIYKSELFNGEYKSVENLGDAINTPDNEYEPFISSDESFLIFMSTRPQGLSNADLYISYNENANWTKAEKLSEHFNSDAIEFSPKITWDGKYFVFSSTRNIHQKNPAKTETTEEYNKRIRNAGNGLGDIYIIDISAVEFMKKKQ
jgi:Tol biopolymer transport system component